MPLSADIIYYLVVPSLLFFAILIFWFIQSTLLLFVSRKYILPVLYKHKITEWFIVELAIAIHELSHLTAAFLTGSEINLKESFVTSKGGRIAARTSQSIGGWISTIIAAFAPAFVPSLVLFVVFITIFQINVPFYKINKVSPYSADLNLYLTTISSNIDVIIKSLIEAILSPSFASLLFFYFLMVSSLTSSPSEDDWKASFNVLLSFPIIPLFVIFLLLNYVSLQFNFNLVLFMVLILSIIAIYVSLGIIINLVFVFLIALFEYLWKKVAVKISRVFKIVD